MNSSSILIKSSTTVSEVENFYNSKFPDKQIEILTDKGNKAGPDRKCRALTEIDLSGGIEIKLAENFDTSIATLKKSTGLSIRTGTQPIQQLKSPNQEMEVDAILGINNQQEEIDVVKFQTKNNAKKTAEKKELEKLIDKAISNNNFNDKEREKLFERAKNKGLNIDEFENLIEDRLLKKRNKESFLKWMNYIVYTRKSGKTIKLWQILVLALIMIGSSIYDKIDHYFKEKNQHKINSELLEKYGGINFNDCLSKYKFDGAYYFYSIAKESFKNSPLHHKHDTEGEDLNKMYQELINAQVVYWAKEKNYEKAYNVIQEFIIDEKYDLDNGKNLANEYYNGEITFYNSLLDNLIDKMMIEKQPKEKLLMYCKSYKEIVKGDPKNKSKDGEFNSFILSDQPYKNALLKINDYNPSKNP